MVARPLRKAALPQAANAGVTTSPKWCHAEVLVAACCRPANACRSTFNTEVAGSSPAAAPRCGVAQRVEHSTTGENLVAVLHEMEKSGVLERMPNAEGITCLWSRWAQVRVLPGARCALVAQSDRAPYKEISSTLDDN